VTAAPNSCILIAMAQRRPPPTTELDLNLLVLLDALLAERNVTRAAERVGLSQSAASHALKRLRNHFDDPLLVRGRDGMALTARAKELAAPIDHALRTLEATLRDASKFDPKRSKRTFTIAMTDYLAVLLLPALHVRIAREAPGVGLRVTTIVAEVEATLASDETDLVITMAAQPDEPGLYQQRLFEERYVCVMRRGHPATKRPLTLDVFCTLEHALISPRNGRGIVDRALAVVGRERRVAVQLPHWLVAPHLVAHSDLVLTVAERLARTYAAILPLEIVVAPLDLPATVCFQRWHERSHGDVAHRWLRELVVEISAASAA
jgi:DNA-binding transcriptional LysR family regulator